MQSQKDRDLPMTDKGLAENSPAISVAPAANINAPPLASKAPANTNAAPTSDKPLVDGSKKTWGERTYDNIVYKVFGFGVNLGFSSYLTYWINHSNRHVPFTQSTPRNISENVKNWFYDSILTGSKANATRDHAGLQINKGRSSIASAMGNALILTMGGHILIPIVKIAEDKKTRIVQWLDKRHYGEDGVQAPEIQAAHDRIAEEIRPTWTSTILSRVVSMGTVQIAARTVGHENNFIKIGGKKISAPFVQEFPGIDKGAEEIGAAIVEKGYLPSSIKNATDRFLISSTKSDPMYRDKIRENEYRDRAPTTMLLKYGVSDIIYTALTASVIKPANNWFMRNFSFMRKEPEKTPTTDRPVVRAGTTLLDRTPEIPPNVLLKEAQENTTTPDTRISEPSHNGPLFAPSMELQKA